jgi:hypothetical protein
MNKFFWGSKNVFPPQEEVRHAPVRFLQPPAQAPHERVRRFFLFIQIHSN